MNESVKHIRIAYVDTARGMGGAEHLLLTLIEGISGEGIETLLYCDPRGALGRFARQRGIEAIEFHGPPLISLSWIIGRTKILNPLAVLWDATCLFGVAWRLWRSLKNARVDIVQTNSAFEHIFGGMAARKLGLPCVWYFHDLVEIDRFHGLARKAWQFLATRLAIRVVCASRASIDALSLSKGMELIHACFSEPATFQGRSIREILDLPPDAKIIGFLGRIAIVKGLDVLAKAALQVLNADPTCEIVVIGGALPSEERYKQTLSELVVELGIASHWHWLGYQPDASRFLASVDLLVLPSRREAFPLVLLEAAIARRSVVATLVGGTGEAIVDGETGILIPPESPDALAKAIVKLTGSRELRERMGQNAERFVRKEFSRDNYFFRFQSLYRSLTSNV